jgi:hypothetical protein
MQLSHGNVTENKLQTRGKTCLKLATILAANSRQKLMQKSQQI